MARTLDSYKEVLEELKETSDDPRSLILPAIQDDMTWVGKYTAKELLLYVPTAVFALAGIVAWFVAPRLVALGVFALAMVSYTAAAALHAQWDVNRPPHEIVSDRVKYYLGIGAFDTGGDQQVAHDVHQGHADNSIERTDDVRLALIPVTGTNSDHLSDEDRQALVASFTDGIDEKITDIWWGFYCTSDAATTKAIAKRRETRALKAHEHGLTERQQEVLLEGADWLSDDDGRWNARDWHNYLLVRAHPGDKPNQDVSKTLDDRVSAVQKGIANVEGVTAGRALLGEQVDLAMDYWAGTCGDHADRRSLAQAGTASRGSGRTALQELLDPSHIDVEIENGKGYISLEGEWARTFWIAQFPMQPSEMFLRHIMTMQGVPANVKITATPENVDHAKDYLESHAPRLDVESDERAARDELSADRVQNASDAYKLGYVLLDNRLVRPWRLNGYVTIRGETREALDSNCEDFLEMLEGTPANCLAKAPATRQADLFRSASPFGKDHYQNNSWTEKRKLAFSGALGAAFPFVAPSIDDPDGLRWGRNTLTGEMVRANPFEAAAGRHLFTFAPTRAGKTYFCSAACTEWFLDGDDRNFIACDTQGGFDGALEVCDGKRIVANGSDTFNPFHIEPAPFHLRRAMGDSYNGFGMKVDDVVEFFASIIQAQGTDPSDYRPILEDLARETYNSVGITPDPSTHHKRSPTPPEFVGVLNDVTENPGDYTLTNSEAEADERKRMAAELATMLSGFKEGARYSDFRGDDDGALDRHDDMAYLDLRALRRQDDLDKSVHLKQMFSQLGQYIKRVPGETIIVFDEAHNLFHSEEATRWVQKAAREFARFDATLWFLTQSPGEIVDRAQGVESDQESHRQTTFEQAFAVQVFRSSNIDKEDLKKIGLEGRALEKAKNELMPGHAKEGYSESLISFTDHRGWIETWVSAPKTLDKINRFEAHKHGDFDLYMDHEWTEAEIDDGFEWVLDPDTDPPEFAEPYLDDDLLAAVPDAPVGADDPAQGAADD